MTNCHVLFDVGICLFNICKITINLIIVVFSTIIISIDVHVFIFSLSFGSIYMVVDSITDYETLSCYLLFETIIKIVGKLTKDQTVLKWVLPNSYHSFDWIKQRQIVYKSIDQREYWYYYVIRCGDGTNQNVHLLCNGFWTTVYITTMIDIMYNTSTSNY